MIGAEFLGMIMLIVYVGAVAVLFLFVVMMLNVAQQKNQWFVSKENSAHIPVGLSLIHISEPTRLGMISYAVFCLKKKNRMNCVF